jgi:protein-S-isoprenylcysteine O-methyltransferase Ste14
LEWREFQAGTCAMGLPQAGRKWYRFRMANEGMLIGEIIWGCWVMFIVYWMISALRVKAVVEKQNRAASLINRLPVMLGYVLLMTARLPGPLNVRLMLSPAYFAPIGAAICVLGVLGAIWSRNILAGNWSSNVTFKKDHELIERGPYRFVRHPIYTSILMMSLGTALAADRLGPFIGLCCVFLGFWIKLKEEEKLLTRHFPGEYPAYQKRVKALVPFVI